MANILWEMIVKMLTHIHMVVYTWWCWHMVFVGALLGKWNAYFLLRRMQILVDSTLEQG